MAEKKILLVGPYNPRKCGIAAHIIQLESALKNEGWVVDILSPNDCEGTYHENLRGGFNVIKILKYTSKYERINIHFSPEQFFYMGQNPLRMFNIFTLLSLCLLFWMAKNSNFVMHEQPTTRFFFQHTFLHKLIWSQVPQITFFTRRELEIFERKFDIIFRADQCKIEEVNKNFQQFSNLTKENARYKLNVDQNKIVFLCIGFIKENKGFDRIAKIFSEDNYENSDLYIVGSVRLEGDNKEKEYFEMLSDICNKVDNIHLISQYLSYEDFDTWIIAADYIVIPYRRISNSGVLGRAKIINRSAIVSNIGGLCDQIDHNDLLFSNDIELKNIVSRIDTLNLE